MPEPGFCRSVRLYATEERFVELFQDVFGPAAAAKLVRQIPFEDIEGRGRFIDFALESDVERYAIEIDGETYHHPAVLDHAQYADQLLKQNSLTHLGWRILRWSDWQLGNDAERVCEHLRLLLDFPVSLMVPQSHLPPRRGALIELFAHQKTALVELDAARRQGNQIVLLPHAVGTGKTTTAIEDARRVGLRTLFLAHTHELIEQATQDFRKLWPEARIARLGDTMDSDAQVVVATIQAVRGQLNRFPADHFGYVIVDEAHHAVAPTYRGVLRYFNPHFLLGLTGTPERHDGQSLLDTFRMEARRMDLSTAVREGLLCDVRCFRMKTNVDLRSLRFSGTTYRQADLEQRVTIPSRNELIVATYCENVNGRRAVTFCVSVQHAEEIAQRFREAGVSAKAVSGSLSRNERTRILEAYDRGDVRVLCACDLLNEGWNAPATEVLLMARPTLSKVIYHQQLGRGMRTHPGKECLIAFDFVDVFSRHNRALSLHRLLRKARYRAGSRVFDDEEGDSCLQELPIHLRIEDMELVDIFDWQDRVEGMVTAPALSRMLRKSEGWVIDRWKRGEIPADEVVDFGGGQRVAYFAQERVTDLRDQFGLTEVTDETLYEDFLRFLDAMDMTFSYKPVWFLALLKCADENGKSLAEDVLREFHGFYQERAAAGDVVERNSAKLSRPEDLSPADVQQVINRGPFDRFSRMDFVEYASDRAFYRISRVVWRRLRDPVERARVEQVLREAIRHYYEPLDR